ncbi:MAG: ribonuclease Z [Candidatus Heimdallarchaeota archaeon]|nr:ribonuclease Z [Candidatus Heimdallarchaeota archaeon]MCK5048122.1 ribonuclease Z [Candidatus Heimdallarchaeota archaeon]
MNEISRIVFLGTGAAMPSSNRFQSCIVINTPARTFICEMGDGTQYPLLWNKVGIGKEIVILCSHLHADHANGIPSFLASLELTSRKRKVSIIGPKGVKNLVLTFFEIFGGRISYPLEILEIEEEWEGKIGETKVKFFEVDHWPGSYGISIHTPDYRGKMKLEELEKLGVPKGELWGRLQAGEKVEWEGKEILPEQVVDRSPGLKIVYSGDTRPCESVIKEANNADILIHDGTFDIGQEELASKYHHSTINDAVEVAQKAQVKQLVITHLSSRIRDRRKAEKKVKEKYEKVIIAEDGLILTPRKGSWEKSWLTK